MSCWAFSMYFFNIYFENGTCVPLISQNCSLFSASNKKSKSKGSKALKKHILPFKLVIIKQYFPQKQIQPDQLNRYFHNLFQFFQKQPQVFLPKHLNKCDYLQIFYAQMRL